MTKAFWLPGLKIVYHTRWIDQKSWCPSNRCSEWFLRPSPVTRDWLDQLTTHAYTSAPDIVLCGNKVLPEYWAFSMNIHFLKSVLAPPSFANDVNFDQVDLEGLRTVSSDRGRAMAAELGLPYFETSAATGQGCIKSWHDHVLQIIQVSRRLWKHCWTLSWPGLREVLPPSGILLPTFCRFTSQ